jgi:hypothetical protein
METFKALSRYASLVLPFLAAAWTLIQAFDEFRGKPWRQAFAIISAVVLIAIGLVNLFGGNP